MVVITVTGLGPIQERLENLDSISDQLATPTREALAFLKERLQIYPPPPSGSTYERTYRLRNSWEETLVLGGGSITSDVEYGPYVMSEGEQARVHVGRWQTVQGVAMDAESAVIAIYEDFLRSVSL